MFDHRSAALAACVLAFSLTGTARAQSFTTQTVQGRNCKIYSPSQPLANPPLVVMLHGCTQDPDQFATGTAMNAVAEKRGWIVLYPEQPSSANQNKCWNWYLADHQQRDKGEPALLAAITSEVVRANKVDPARVYVCGLSAGAAMSVILGATYPDVFAAIGVCSGLEYGAATDVPSAYTAMSNGGPSAQQQGDAAWKAMGPAARLVPVMVFHGSADHTVAPKNADQIVAEWVETDDLAPDGKLKPTLPTTPTRTTNATAPGGLGYTLSEYADSSGHTVVALVLVSGMDHAWSGGNSAGSYTEPRGPDASTMLADFFANNPRSGSAPAPAPGVAPITVADPPGGVFTGSVSVTLRPNRAATTYYTEDGSAPTTASSVASGPLVLSAQGSPSSVTLRFFSVDAAGSAETPREERYTLIPGSPAPAPCPCGGQTKTVVLASQAANDGFVGRLYAAPGSLLLGDSGATAGEAERVVLSFDTSSIPGGARIVSVRLQVCRSFSTGTMGSVSVDVNEGALGTSAGLEAAANLDPEAPQLIVTFVP